MDTRRLGTTSVILSVLLLALAVVGCGPLIDLENIQDRARIPSSRIGSGQSIGQTFVASQPQLTALDLLLAVYPPEQNEASGQLVFRLRSSPESTYDLAVTRVDVAGLLHNTRYRFRFPPQADSAGRSYYLLIESTTPVPARPTVWSSGLDAYSNGSQFVDGQPVQGDLTFRAYYAYSLAWLLSDLSNAIALRWWALAAILAALILPGYHLQRAALRNLNLDLAEKVGLWIGLSVALTPILLLFSTHLGLRLGPESIRGFLAVLGMIAALQKLHDWRHGWRPTLPGVFSPGVGALATTLGALMLRFVHARDLPLPLWVDSVQHTLFARLIVESGQLPADYGPLIASQPFVYHFGFHVLVAIGHWLTALDVARLVLVVGQLLSGLIVLPVYLLTNYLVGDRRAGLAAGLIVGLVSTMPAYYVSWGRYPQLAGLIVLCVALVMLREILARDGFSPGASLLASASLAGLVLVHPRVALLYGAYATAFLSLSLIWSNRGSAKLGCRAKPNTVGTKSLLEQGKCVPDSLASVTAADLAASPSTGSFSIVLGRAAGASDVKRDSVGEADRKRMPRALEHLASGIRSSISRFPPIGARLAVLAALTLLATAPWLLRLDGSHPGSHLVGFRPHTPVDFPLAMLTSSNDRWLLTSALVGIALGIYQRHRLAVELVFWVALSLLVTNSRQLGLPVNLMFPNDALAIMLFLPIALACGGLVASLAQAANIARWPWAQRVVGVVLMASIGVWGGTQLVGIVNPICILARPADLSAIEWVRENTPVDSKFLINSFEWRPGAYAGSDAGYWLIPLADRRSSVPPLIYRLGDSEQMEAVESLAVATSQQPINPNALLPLLGEQGITHLFIGDRGGSLHPDHFTDAVGYRLAYSNGRAWVFEVDHSGLEMR